MRPLHESDDELSGDLSIKIHIKKPTQRVGFFKARK